MRTILAFLVALVPIGLAIACINIEELTGPAASVIAIAGILVTVSLFLLFFRREETLW